ncbi:hypothetical protein E2C01_012946 [Portunus trituberculatus]|uniref:Uncharacterized protein n=1 Tax=Portunus trituberculatus TaxID=210409 RepID=A0A5B7DFY3_PORTR|nr:hypothetical protein [Portunus trituberculatus]
METLSWEISELVKRGMPCIVLATDPDSLRAVLWDDGGITVRLDDATATATTTTDTTSTTTTTITITTTITTIQLSHPIARFPYCMHGSFFFLFFLLFLARTPVFGTSGIFRKSFLIVSVMDFRLYS